MFSFGNRVYHVEPVGDWKCPFKCTALYSGDNDFPAGFKGWAALPCVLRRALPGEGRCHPLGARPARCTARVPLATPRAMGPRCEPGNEHPVSVICALWGALQARTESRQVWAHSVPETSIKATPRKSGFLPEVAPSVNQL